MIGSAVLGAFLSLPATVNLTVQPSQPLHALRPAGMTGTVLPIWYSPEKVQGMAEGLRRGQFSLFRYPNGTLSNEYHWNGTGTYDSVGIWHPSNETFTPGFKADSRYRGTSRNNYGSIFASMMVDNDTASFWWGMAEQDSLEPWVMLNLSGEAKVDSLEILWGDLRPDSVVVQILTEGGALWSNDAVWSAPLTIPVNGAATRAKLASVLDNSWFKLRLHGKQGSQVREVRLFANGEVVTDNDAASSTMVYAMGTHPGSDPTGETPSRWDFVTYMTTIQREFPGSVPLLCVNVGTGTPEEAAAWVHFANKVKGYGVRQWHVGNEIDGNWEQGGPLDPGQYASRYIAFVKAMKAVDSTIEVYGPVLSTMDFSNRPSGRNSESWMGSFLRRIGEVEKADGRRYLDGVDFHAYPYYLPSGAGSPTSMLNAMDNLGMQLDTLATWMNRYLTDAGSRKVAMTEFNASVSITYLLLHQTNGIGMANMLAQMASHFGDRAITCLWEPEGGEPMNPDGTSGSTYGSLRIFTPNRKGLTTDIGNAPTSAFWGQFLATQAWIERGRAGDSGAPTSIPVEIAGSTNARAYALVDSGRVSVLVLNLGGIADSITLAGATVDSGEALSWSQKHYTWLGTDADARAIPNLGPTAAVWNGGKVLLPAYGAVVLRTSRRTVATPKLEMLLRTVSKSAMTVGDTTTISSTVRQKGGKLTGAVVTRSPCPDQGVCVDTLKSFDGAWDGSMEGVVFKIATNRLLLGSNRLVFVFQGSGGTVLTDTVNLVVNDVPRPTVWIDRFDKRTRSSELPGGISWANYVANATGTTTMKASLPVWPDSSINKRWAQMDFNIDQPSGMGYANYIATSLNLPRKWLDTLAGAAVGLSFDWFTSVDSGSSGFELHIPEDSVKDYDDHIVKIAGTKGTWVRKTLLWNDFQQAGWGKAVGALDFRTAQKLEFRAAGAGRGNFRLDNLTLLFTKGDSVYAPVWVNRRSPGASGWTVRRTGHVLSMSMPGATDGQARLYDHSGRLVARTSGNNELLLNLPKTGLYFLELQAGGKREVRRIGMIR